MTLSQISSHYAGMLKAHSPSQEQRFAWEAIMLLSNKVENLEKQVSALESKLHRVSDDASYAASMTRPIGCSHLKNTNK